MAAAVLELSPASPCAVCLVEGLLVVDLVRLLVLLVLVRLRVFVPNPLGRFGIDNQLTVKGLYNRKP